jgi:hypothetical protein
MTEMIGMSQDYSKANERIEAIVRAWPQWSHAERRRMDEIVQEVLSHCRDGQGNQFIREWCEKFLP